nr:uncharacterized protein LOC103350054 [Oryctolagus cuniculus]
MDTAQSTVKQVACSGWRTERGFQWSQRLVRRDELRHVPAERRFRQRLFQGVLAGPDSLPSTGAHPGVRLLLSVLRRRLLRLRLGRRLLRQRRRLLRRQRLLRLELHRLLLLSEEASPAAQRLLLLLWGRQPEVAALG